MSIKNAWSRNMYVQKNEQPRMLLALCSHHLPTTVVLGKYWRKLRG